MTVATLKIQTEGGADVVALIERVERSVRGSRQRMVRETRAAAQQEAGAYRNSVVVIERAEQLLTRAKMRELAKQDAAQKKFIQVYTDAHKRATAAVEAEVGKRGNLSDRERRQVETLALAMVTEHERAERRRTAATEAAEKRRASARRQFLAGAPAAAGNAALRGVAAFADFGDDIRERRRARREIDLQAVQIAASDIGDARAARELSLATQQVASNTGLDPRAIMQALGNAQANFSALANTDDDPDKRATYLRDVLPMLAQAAVATGSSLEDMVNAAGEYTRQLNISGQEMPRAIAQAIAEGRLGSIGFRDVAGHMGVVAGAASRTISSERADSLHSRALVGTLFQFAGRAGGSGDEAATRARAFFDNLSSGRGQNALRHGLGYNAFDATGQIARRDGETQVDAFQRIVQDAYRRSGGNSTKFLDMMAGNNTRSRTLGDQLFRDLRAHGGRLTDFRGIIDQSMRATPQDAVGEPFRAITATEANRDARRDVGDFYRLTGGSTQWARDTDEQIRAMREEHPFIGALLGNNETFRGALDATNAGAQQNLAGVAGGGARPQSQEALLRAIAHDRAVAIARERDRQNFGSLAPVLDVLFGGNDGDLVKNLEREQYQQLQQRAPQTPQERRPTVTLAPESVQALAHAIASNPPTISDHAATHLATTNASRRGE